MTSPAAVRFVETDLDAIAAAQGRVAVFVTPEGRLDPAARRVNRLTKGALARMIEGGALEEKEAGDVLSLAWPSGLAAQALDVVVLPRNAGVEDSRRAGVALGRAKGSASLTILGGTLKRPAEVTQGAVLRAYDFTAHKTGETAAPEDITVMVRDPGTAETDFAPLNEVVGGVFLTRDLVNAPANHLTTTAFVAEIEALAALGVKVTVLNESEMEQLGMGALLCVGQGSASPSHLAVMEWRGGGDAAPLALVGKGVVFDTGGISIKPAAGMEDMTMDMGGAGVVTGVMRALGGRKARANVIGLVGLVENMPSGTAVRPGDVVTSMKGDTVEVINTDAEGRLVLADVLWYAQKTYHPAAIIDLATLTGAAIIALGHENAAALSNDDALCDSVLKAARAEGEGLWRLPLGKGYAKALKSRIADVKNVGGRPAGTITAAEFLHRFIDEGTPWVHLDIAGMASVKSESVHAPEGASGWGVLTLDRLVRDRFEEA